MAQPSFVPISEADQVRPALHMHVPGVWTTDRPAEVVVPEHERGRTLGTPGPDSGFAMRLANRFGEELKLGEGETEHDVLLGVALIASKRAALYGRGPSVYDVRFGLNLWGFLDDAPAALPRRAPGGVLFDLPRLRGPACSGRFGRGRHSPAQPG